jgi:hypothetical protein
MQVTPQVYLTYGPPLFRQWAIIQLCPRRVHEIETVIAFVIPLAKEIFINLSFASWYRCAGLPASVAY